MKTLIIAITLLLSSAIFADTPSIENLHKAILKQEGWKGPGTTGDNGKALGPYQIWYEYWKDATDFDKSIGGKYEDVENLQYARKVFNAYMRRYATERRIGRPVTWEDIARIHNGGPNGYKKAATLKYWDNVKNYLHFF